MVLGSLEWGNERTGFLDVGNGGNDMFLGCWVCMKGEDRVICWECRKRRDMVLGCWGSRKRRDMALGCWGM